MKSPLLVLSLFANAALLAGVAYLVLTPSRLPRPDTQKENSPPERPKPVAPSPGMAPDSALVTAPSPGLWQSPDDVEAWLRSNGAPPRVRLVVAHAMLDRKYGAAVNAVRFPPGLKRWQRGIRPSQEQKEQLSALNLERKQELQRILGADYAKANFAENIEELSGIPTEKLVELNRVTADYMEAGMKLRAGGKLSPDAQRLLNDEMNADLRKILTPEEFELHQAYETQDGQRMQQWMAGLDVSDETYLRIYRAAAAVKDRNKDSSFAPGYRVEEIRAIEKAVGPEIAAHIMTNQDETFREIGAIYSASKIPAGAMLERYKTWFDYHKALTSLRNPSPGKLDDAQRATILTYYDRMTNGLSPAARSEFDRTKAGAGMTRLLSVK